MNSDLSINDLKTHAPTEFSDPFLLKLERGKVLSAKYRLEEKVGEGGMGVVWKAYDTVGERYVALKFVPAEIRYREEAIIQVKKTFSTIQALNHTHICPVLALEKDAVLGYYLVMKWLEGMTLAELQKTGLLRENGAEIRLVLPILEAVAEALDYAHAHHVIHRDVKPSNIFVALKQGKGTGKMTLGELMKVPEVAEVFLIDFGLATEIVETMTRFSKRKVDTSGTWPYMPPEQWKGKKQTPQTDQYALGVVAYELLAGERPFMISDVTLLRLAVMQDEPEEIRGRPESVNKALQRALAKKQTDRFPTCAEFITALGKSPALYRSVGEGMEKVVDGVKYPFRWCPPGRFLMGSPETEEKRYSDEGPRHQVTLTRGFWMLGKHR
ncbi:MAG: protein kinase [Planctomycetia bacterium]|nr:protein kinase [Planctomycetia bacterium]